MEAATPPRNGDEGGDDRTMSSSFGAMQFPALRFLRSPLSSLLDYSGILSPTSSSSRHESAAPTFNGVEDSRPSSPTSCSGGSSNGGEISIRIIGAGERGGDDELDRQVGMDERVPLAAAESEAEENHQRYDIQQVARWIEKVLPFSLLLFVVFIRQHLQGFFVTIWISVVWYRSNDIVRKQTALKGDRNISFLVGIAGAFMLHVVGIYWWYQNDDLIYPLAMVPPKAIPPF